MVTNKQDETEKKQRMKQKTIRNKSEYTKANI